MATMFRRFISYCIRLCAGYYIIGLFVCTGISAEPVFKLKGFEYERLVNLPSGSVNVTDNTFIHSEVLGNRILLFYKSDGKLKMSILNTAKKDLKPTQNRVIGEVDRYTNPVIRRDGDKIYILLYIGNEYRLFQLNNPDLKPVKLFSVSSRIGFNYDLHVFKDFYLISLPHIENGKHNCKFMYVSRNGKQPEQPTILFPPIEEETKGRFFPIVNREGNEYSIYFLSRQYASGNKAIHDNLSTIRIRDIFSLHDATVSTMLPKGFSDHPLVYIEYNNKIYFFTPRKRQSIYNLKMIDMQTKLEYHLSPRYAHAYGVDILQKNNMLDLFYIQQVQSNCQLVYRKLDLNKINNVGYMDSDRNSVVTSDSFIIRSYDLCRLKKDTYVFFLPEGKNKIYFSKTDRSTPKIRVNTVYKVNEDRSKVYPQLYWEEPDDPSGIAGYAYAINKLAKYNPETVNLSADERYVPTKHISTGNYVFHIRAIDNFFNVGPTVHVPFEIKPYTSEKRAITVPVAVAVVETNEEIETYDSAPYEVYQNYMNIAREKYNEGNMLYARKYLNLATVILPNRLETFILLQAISKRENKFFNRYRIQIILFFIFIIWMIIWLAVYILAKV
jgi:hypothetical protein